MQHRSDGGDKISTIYVTTTQLIEKRDLDVDTSNWTASLLQEVETYGSAAMSSACSQLITPTPTTTATALVISTSAVTVEVRRCQLRRLETSLTFLPPQTCLSAPTTLYVALYHNTATAVA